MLKGEDLDQIKVKKCELLDLNHKVHQNCLSLSGSAHISLESWHSSPSLFLSDLLSLKIWCWGCWPQILDYRVNRQKVMWTILSTLFCFSMSIVCIKVHHKWKTCIPRSLQEYWSTLCDHKKVSMWASCTGCQGGSHGPFITWSVTSYDPWKQGRK